MPLLLSCDELEPGMRLFDPIVRGSRTLLTAGKVLTHADVHVLRAKYGNVWVRVGDPILDDVTEFEDDSHDRAVATTAQQKIVQAMSGVSERFSSRASLRSLDVHAIHDSVAEVIAYLENNPVSTALLTQCLETDSYLSEHAGNVFYLSMILGSAVRDYVSAERQRTTACRWLDLKISMDLLPLGIGAMFADVGMLPLQHLLSSNEPLTDEDREAIRQHPIVGTEMLSSEFAPAARAVVRTHHENSEGGGYPAGLRGDQIHIFARIVRIADAYDASTASHIYKEAKSPARALWEMNIGSYRHFYDPVLMKFFVRLIQPFPIGARLRLRDGRFCVVVRYNREEPFKPTVVIAFDPNGERLPNSQLEGPLSLADRRDLRIHSFGNELLSYLYVPQWAEDEALPVPGFKTMFEASFP